MPRPRGLLRLTDGSLRDVQMHWPSISLQDSIYPRDLYKVVFGGENWSGLRERVESSSLPYRDQVLAIIDTIPAEINYAQKSSRKKALMDFAGWGAIPIYAQRNFSFVA